MKNAKKSETIWKSIVVEIHGVKINYDLKDNERLLKKIPRKKKRIIPICRKKYYQSITNVSLEESIIDNNVNYTDEDILKILDDVDSEPNNNAEQQKYTPLKRKIYLLPLLTGFTTKQIENDEMSDFDFMISQMSDTDDFFQIYDQKI